jgi:hypothetical protein
VKRVRTCDGPVKNSGEIFPADQNASQIASARTTEMPPMIARSYFW